VALLPVAAWLVPRIAAAAAAAAAGHLISQHRLLLLLLLLMQSLPWQRKAGRCRANGI